MVANEAPAPDARDTDSLDEALADYLHEGALADTGVWEAVSEGAAASTLERRAS